MAKINDIRALAEEHAQEVSRSPRDWMGYLDTVARLYRYSFQDNLLIHAQRPDATACAEMELWNKRMNRWVNRGSKGIALLDNTGPRERLRYVFDISDTHMVRGGRTPFLWEMETEHQARILDHLIDTYGLEEKDSVSLPGALIAVAGQEADENFEEAFYGLADETEGSYLEGLDEETMEVEFRNLLKNSISYTLLRRSGFDPGDYLDEEDFRNITDYNRLSVLSFLGGAACELSEPVLRDIGRQIRVIYQENLSEQLAKSVDSMYSINKEFTTLKQESVNEHSEGGNEHGTDISSQGGLSVSEPDRGTDGAGEHREVRDAEEDISERESPELVSEHGDDRETEQASGGHRKSSGRADGRTDGGTAETVPGTGQGGRPAGVGSAHEQPAGDGGRDHSEGIGLLLTDDKTEQDLSEAEEETASALFLPELPTQEQQIRTIEEAMEASFAGNIPIPEEVVDEILRSGGNRDGSQLRIIYNFMIDQTPEDYTEFVKREYGTGGKGFVIGGRPYAVWFDNTGFMIADGHTVFDKGTEKAFIPWEDVSDRIGQLLRQGEYAPQVVLDAARSNALKEHAQVLGYMERDLEDGIAELVFKDTSIFSGGWPDEIERLSGLLDNPEFLEDLNERLDALAEVYAESPEIMRSHYYRPDRVAEQFKKFAKEAVPFQAKEGFTWQEHEHFITQDEIDAFLTEGGPSSNGRLAIYSFYMLNHSDREKAEFLRDHYGTGGRSHALSGADDSYADYSAKGIELSRGTIGDPYTSVSLSWSKAAQRVDSLIKNDRFLKPEDYSRKDEYERERMAGRVMRFYRGLSGDVERPFTQDISGEKTAAGIARIISDNEQLGDLITQMSQTLAALPLNSEGYDARNQILTDLYGYWEGTYTIFPEQKKEAEVFTGRQMTMFDFMSEEEEAEQENITEHENVPEQGNASEQGNVTVRQPDNQQRLSRETEEYQQNDSAEIQEDETFEYQGYHYRPVGISSETINADEVGERIIFDYMEFYEKSGVPTGLDADVFYCVETGKNYIATSYFLSEYDGGFKPYQTANISQMERTGAPDDDIQQRERQAEDTQQHMTQTEVSDMSQSQETVHPEDLPIDATVYIDGREFRIDSVDYQRDRVTMQDMTMAKEARYPIFRVESVGFVRSYYEEQNEPAFDFGTENRVADAMEHAGFVHEDFSPEQMDVIYEAALKKLNIEPMINPEFSVEQMQLIADLAERTAAGERAAFEGVMAPLSGHVMSPEEINIVRRQYRLPLDSFGADSNEPEQDQAESQYESGQEGSKTPDDGEVRLRSIVIELNPSEPQEMSETQEPVNFHITDDDLGAGGPKAKFRANMDAIHLLKELEAEGRLASPEEQEVLSRFVGWGGIPQAFDADNAAWSSEYAEVKAALTPEEYREARSSTLNAFYTSPTVIKAMYSALENMGLRSGNVLEPSCGVGNFMGLVPESMDGIKMYGVELDSISGRIAQQLYQKNQIAVQGFETMQFPDSFFDCAVGNVPFGSYKVNDPKYDRYNFLIHDYFIARSLDLVRPGGVVAFVTSSGTMDKQDDSVRRYLAERADLLGAIRLPNNAFMRNANTGVVSDILFLQKRDRISLDEPDWVHLGQTPEGHSINSYFADHPEMVLGEITTENTQYGRQEITVKPVEGADLADQLKEAVSHIHGTITEMEFEDSEIDDADTSIPADPSVRNFSFANVNGQVYYRENSRMNLMELPKATTERVLGMIELRDTVQELLDIQVQDGSDAEIAVLQQKLNSQYDSFTAQYDLINSTANRRAFSQDSSYCLLASLEILDEEGKLERKADIFTRRTIRRAEPVTSVDTASEALALSIGEKARVDVSFMAQLAGKSEEEITEELTGVIFKNPVTEEWETSDEYLSGNVREKLKVARGFAESHPEYEINVSCLEKVQPKDLDASEIEARLGATWIKPEYITQFMAETFHTPWYLLHDDMIAVHYSPVSGQWEVSGKTRDYNNPRVNVAYGTARVGAYRLLEDALNLRTTKVYDSVRYADGEHRVLNKQETALAQQKQEMIKDAFKEWIFRDVDRREDLCRTYNETFNSIRPREYDGSHIQFVGMTPEITLMPHQKDAVAHILYGGNTLLAHCVGAGKTFQMVAAGMESRRLGLAQKCLYVVPNHLTEQWGSDFLRLYPGANILVATKKDFEPANRKKFCSRIATGDYDAIIIGHSQFERIPLSRERQIASIEKQIEDITGAIADAGRESGSRFTVKQMERTRKSLQTRLDRLNNQSIKDDVVTFEQLGVDRLFVDESHNYKNLFLYTKMRNVAGISQTDAQKSSDMFMKCQYMDEITGGRGVTFATGTPISNSMVELYTIMRYLQYDTLQKTGLGHFDSWAASFGETVTAIELAPEGTGYRAKTRFARFFNLPELISMFKECADVQTADMLNLPVPKAEYINEVLKPSEIQQDMVSSFADRAEKVRNGSVDSRVDNMLKITNDGRKCALDQRLLNDMLPDEPESKVNRCVANVYQIWKDTAAERSTQMIFCDLSTPKTDGSFNVYDDVRNKLTAMGIPKEEIAFIHEAATETKKAELFAQVRSGHVRVLLGSTAKLGTGTNIQDRLIALHHLDVPWKPSDLEQQEGRILRQGNRNPEVKIYRYITEGTFDAYMWQLLENKQKFISQIMTSKSPVRSAEDVDDAALSYAEIKALATGNPYIKEKMDLDVQVSKLKMLKANHTSQIYRLESDIAKKYPQEITATRERIEGLKTDMEAAKSILSQDKDSFEMTVGGTVFTDRKEAGTALIAACAGLKAVRTAGQIGEYHGFTLNASYDGFNQQYLLSIKGQCSYTIEVGRDASGNIQRIQNALGGIEKKLSESEQKLGSLQEELASAQEEVKKPFAQAQELEEKSARLAELNAMLNMDERGPNDAIGLDEEDQTEGAPNGTEGTYIADVAMTAVTFAERAADAKESKTLDKSVDAQDRPSVLSKLHEKQGQKADRTGKQSISKKHEETL